MKKCLKCGAEYRDDDMFCSKCGGDLAIVDACQQCGKSVSVEETYCKHCGYKIEKEYKCEKCGALIDEDSKFCKECGAKVTNPVVSVKQTTVKPVEAKKAKAAFNETGSKGMSPKLQKVFYYVFGGVVLFAFALMFIGCFGEIIHSDGASLGSGTTSTINVSYFFKEAIDNFKTARQMERPAYSIYLIFYYIFELLAWLAAIGCAVIGVIEGILIVTRGSKKEFKLKIRPLIFVFLGTVPYLLLFGLQNMAKISGGGINGESGFGWGTSMIVAGIIIGSIAIIAYDIIVAIFERKDIVGQAVRGGIAFTILIAFVASLGYIVGFNYSYSTYSISGAVTSQLPWEYALTMFSRDASYSMPGYSWLSCLSFLLTIIAYTFVVILIINLINKKDASAVITNASFAMFFILVGHILGVISGKQFFKDLIGSTGELNVLIGAGGIVLILFAIGAIVGVSILNSLNKKSQNAQPVQA